MIVFPYVDVSSLSALITLENKLFMYFPARTAQIPLKKTDIEMRKR